VKDLHVGALDRASVALGLDNDEHLEARDREADRGIEHVAAVDALDRVQHADVEILDLGRHRAEQLGDEALELRGRDVGRRVARGDARDLRFIVHSARMADATGPTRTHPEGRWWRLRVERGDRRVRKFSLAEKSGSTQRRTAPII
jgi:hypothetical protein